MKVRILVILTVLLALTGLQSANAYDLEDYPAPFLEDSDLNVRIVIGNDCCTPYVVEAANLIATLKSESFSTIEATSNIDTDTFSKTSAPILTIGGPHENRFTAEVLGLTYPTNPAEAGIPQKYALLEQKTYQGNPILLVAGSTEEATLAALDVLKNYNKYPLQGHAQLVSENKELRGKSEDCTSGCGSWGKCTDGKKVRICYSLFCEQQEEEQNCQLCTEGWLDQPFCKEGNVYDVYTSEDCGEVEKLKLECEEGKKCENGACQDGAKNITTNAVKSEGFLQAIVSFIRNLLNL